MPRDEPSDSKAIVSRCIEELWNAGRRELAGEFVHRNFVRHHERNRDDDVRGLDEFTAWLTTTRRAMPDLRLEVRRMFAENDRVMVHLEARGTHRADLKRVPAGGTALSFTVTGIVRIAEGKIAEAWVIADTLGILQQIGALPPTG